jgi:hypothetical protein
MDGSTLNGNTRATPGASFVDAAAVNGWGHHHHHQQDFIKPEQQQQQQIQQQQQQLASYESPPAIGYVAVTSGPADNEVKPSLIDPQQAENFAELQRLSQEYTPDVQVCSEFLRLLGGA